RGGGCCKRAGNFGFAFESFGFTLKHFGFAFEGLENFRFAFELEKDFLNWIETQSLTDSRKAAAMDWQGTQLFQSPAMLRRWITFMSGQSISGIQRVKLDHVSVSSSLSDYGGRRYRSRQSIATNYASLRHCTIRNTASIDQHVLRRAT